MCGVGVDAHDKRLPPIRSPEFSALLRGLQSLEFDGQIRPCHHHSRPAHSFPAFFEEMNDDLPFVESATFDHRPLPVAAVWVVDLDQCLESPMRTSNGYTRVIYPVAAILSPRGSPASPGRIYRRWLPSPASPVVAANRVKGACSGLSRHPRFMSRRDLGAGDRRHGNIRACRCVRHGWRTAARRRTVLRTWCATPMSAGANRAAALRRRRRRELPPWPVPEPVQVVATAVSYPDLVSRLTLRDRLSIGLWRAYLRLGWSRGLPLGVCGGSWRSRVGPERGLGCWLRQGW